MEYRQNSTIVAQMQPIFDALPEKLKGEKNRRGLTNQQLSDISGVPIATTSRILAGAVNNPGIYHIAPLCVALGVSLDGLMGVAPPPGDDAAELAALRQELAHREEIIAEKDKSVALLQERSYMMEREILALNAQIAETRRTWKPMLYGLCGLCILLTVVWGIYVVLDARQPDVGLIRTGAISPFVWIGAAAVVVLLVMLLHFTVSRWYRKSKGGAADGT